MNKYLGDFPTSVANETVTDTWPKKLRFTFKNAIYCGGEITENHETACPIASSGRMQLIFSFLLNVGNPLHTMDNSLTMQGGGAFLLIYKLFHNHSQRLSFKGF